MFNFDIDENDLDHDILANHAFARTQPNDRADHSSSSPSAGGGAPSASACSRLDLDEELRSLPPLISYTPLHIPLRPASSALSEPLPYPSARGRTTTLHRRDLFDVRFQLMASDDDDNAAVSANASTSSPSFINSASDLVPGVYEGGLKTWEASLDLVSVLADSVDADETEGKGKRRTGGAERGTDWAWVRGKSILELGCGSAMPTLFLLRQLFSLPPPSPCSSSARHGDGDRGGKGPLLTRVHLSDFNEHVLRLVTLPNIVLTWYFSPASKAFRSSPGHGSALMSTTSSAHPNHSRDNDNDDEEEGEVEDVAVTDGTASAPSSRPAPSSSVPSPAHEDEDEDEDEDLEYSQPGELELTPDLVAAFKASLQERGIELGLWAGSWEGFDVADAFRARQIDDKVTNTNTNSPRSPPPTYDVVLSSETIYRTDSLPSLLDVLQRTCRPSSSAPPSPSHSAAVSVDPTRLVASRLAAATLADSSTATAGERSIEAEKREKEGSDADGTLCLIAAKLLYFGVGGDVEAFTKSVRERGGTVETVRDIEAGVGRRVMSVHWR